MFEWKGSVEWARAICLFTPSLKALRDLMNTCYGGNRCRWVWEEGCLGANSACISGNRQCFIDTQGQRAHLDAGHWTVIIGNGQSNCVREMKRDEEKCNVPGSLSVVSVRSV